MNNLLKSPVLGSSKFKLFLLVNVIVLFTWCIIYFVQLQSSFTPFNESLQEEVEITNIIGIGDPEAEKKKLEERHKYIVYEKIKDGIKNVRNVPDSLFVYGAYGQTFLKNSSCAPFPTLLDIRFTNIYWQSQSASSWTFHIFGAYWDDRELNEGGPSIRILGIVDQEVKNVTAYCQIWFEQEKEPTIVQVKNYELSWIFTFPSHRKYNGIYPYHWNCPLSLEHHGKMPISVSVVENICDQATTNVKIHFEKPKKKEKVGVCVKSVNFPYSDISARLIEWLEIVKLFGAHKVFLYKQNVHPNISKVLEHYIKTEFVDVAEISYPGGVSNEVSLAKAFELVAEERSWMTEIIPLNDCLYRNLYNYEYLAVIDIDEVFVSRKLKSWPELIDDLEDEFGNTSIITSFAFQNTIFHPEIKLDPKSQKKFGIPPFMNMLQEVHRECDSRPPLHGTKCFHNPLRVKTMHNHFPLHCLGWCNYVHVNASVAHTHHYRIGNFKMESCKNKSLVVDTALWKWKTEIIENTSYVLKKLNLI